MLFRNYYELNFENKRLLISEFFLDYCDPIDVETITYQRLTLAKNGGVVDKKNDLPRKLKPFVKVAKTDIF